MQRALTILGIIILFAVGAYAIAGGFSAVKPTYEVPADPLLAAVLVGALAGVIILTAVVGGGLAFTFGFLSKELTVEPPGAPGESKPDASAPDGYIPPYSYKQIPENVEVRQWIIGAIVVLVALAGYAAYANSAALVALAQSFTPLQWLILGGSVAAVVALTVGGGAGLAFWFYRTQLEAERTAAQGGPMWPAPQIAALQEKLKPAAVLESLKQMTFLDTLLIGVNVLLVVVILTVIGVWVAPGVGLVLSVDASRRPAAAPAEAAGAPAAPQTAFAGPAEKLKQEFAALPPGDAAAGQQDFAAGPCAACHATSGDTVIVGPSLAGVGTRAAARKAGYSAELYIYESIVHPSAYVVPGFSDGVMPQNLKQTLSSQQMADIIAYLLTLK